MEPVITAKPSRYIRDYDALFGPIRVHQLCDKARNGQLRHCQFRSLCWRYFLHCLPEQHELWPKSCAKSRQKYEQIKAKHWPSKQLDEQQSSSPTTVKESHKKQPISDNKQQQENVTTTTTASALPANAVARRRELEEEQQYIRAANQCDHKNVFRTIERDVVRTFPDMEFFRQTEMQSILENVLFNFASENPHLSYKQGMHELLATLLYVLHTDSRNCLINYEGGYANDTIATLLDLKYLEHDVFHLFTALMKSIETWYQNDEILMVPDGSDKNKDNGASVVSSRSSRQQTSSVLGIKLKMISENIVKNYDLELFNHLEALQIAPQIYGIRWMRLLFGREFEFLDLLTVWDAIICDKTTMSLIDYIFASMLITIREELVNGDYTECLNNLMRHQFKDVQYVIKLALHLREPPNYDRPKPPPPPLHNQKRYSQTLQHNRHSPVTSLTSKLSQHYIRGMQQIQQIQQQSNSQIRNFLPIREYEMREMQSSSASNSKHRPPAKFPIGSISGSRISNALNLSTESYDDLRSIVDYCWRLLSEQIDSLQRCLPKEKSLHSEDEIFLALAQLKKVRDVLKGSLRLEDELEPQSGGSKT